MQKYAAEREFLSFEHSHTSMHSPVEIIKVFFCKADQLIITLILYSEVKLYPDDLPPLRHSSIACYIQEP